MAGEAFELVVRIKNASSDISATNLLFSLESEKASESAVFSTESGSSSVALNALSPGASTELKYLLTSRPGVDQRAYGLTVKAKFDSPEYKNAEEELKMDIMVNQNARFTTGTFEVMPESITVGSESNVMFGINNTGKVMLYNVTASFEADSIQKTESYVGNIKPGETGNVDCMVAGVAPTTDEGKVKVLISYEDENGEIFSEEREITLFVEEDLSNMEDIDVGFIEDELPGEKQGFLSFVQGNRRLLLVAACVAVLLVVIIIFVVLLLKKRKKKKAEMELDEDGDEEE